MTEFVIRPDDPEHASNALRACMLESLRAGLCLRTIESTLLSKDFFGSEEYIETFSPAFAKLDSLCIGVDGYDHTQYAEKWPIPAFAEALRSASLLEDLEIYVSTRSGEEYFEVRKPSDFKRMVLTNVWPHLHTLSLEDFDCEEEHFTNFVITHRTTLASLHLGAVHLTVAFGIRPSQNLLGNCQCSKRHHSLAY